MTLNRSVSEHRQIPTICPLVAAIALFVSSFALFALLAPHAFLNGDMPVYAEQIRDGNFSERTTHIGYFLIGYVFTVTPVPLDYALNLMSAAFSAGIILLVYFTALEITASRGTALASAAVMLVNNALLIEAIHAEVYAAQTFFCVASLFAWMKHRPILAGILFAWAFLISASSVFFLAAFPFFRFDIRAIVLAGAAASTIVLIVLAPHFDNYLFGARGISGAAGKGVDIKLAALKDGRDVFFGFYMFVPFLIAGAVVGIHDRKLRPFVLSIAAAGLVTFAFGEKFMDVPVQLAVYCLCSILAGIGITRVNEAGTLWICLTAAAALSVVVVVLFVPVPARIADHLPSTLLLYGFVAGSIVAVLAKAHPVPVLALAWLVTAGTAYSRLIDSAKEADAFARASRDTYARAGPNALFVGTWNELMRFNWNARRRTYTDDMAISTEKARISAAIRDDRAIILLARKPPDARGGIKAFGVLPARIHAQFTD